MFPAPWWGTAPALRERNLLREKARGQILTIQERHHIQATDTARTGRLRGFDGNQRLGAWGAKRRESVPRKVRADPELGRGWLRAESTLQGAGTASGKPQRPDTAREAQEPQKCGKAEP